jgi:putative SOS response-associated peptidase YedK
MPVILKPENESLWPAPAVTEERTLKPLLSAYPPEEMKMTPVSYSLNSPRNKDASVLTPDPELL